MPLLVDDKGNARYQGENTSTVGCAPTDFSPLLTGGYGTNGILDKRLCAYGSDYVPGEIVDIVKNFLGVEGCYEFYPTKKETIISTAGNSGNIDLSTAEPFTVLIKDTSLFTDFERGKYLSYGRPQENILEESSAEWNLPHHIFEDILFTLEEKKTKKQINLYSRLFLERITVFIGKKTHYVMGDYLLMVINKENNKVKVFRSSENYYNTDPRYYSKEDNLIAKLYERADQPPTLTDLLPQESRAYNIMENNSGVLSERDCGRPMYDLLVRELELMREPKAISEILKAFAMKSYTLAGNTVYLVGGTDIPLKLYMSDIGRVINGYKSLQQFELKLKNIPMFVVTELAPFYEKFHSQIPELSDKKYSSPSDNLTLEQISAIESPQLVTVVEGGAGTGKTEVIKHRLKMMSENGIDMHKVCVFTINRENAEKIKCVNKDVNVLTYKEYMHKRVRALLNEVVDTGKDPARGKMLEDFYKAYMASIGQKNEWSAADPGNIDSIIMYINAENMKLEYQHIIMDDIHLISNLDAVIMLKLGLKNGASIYMTGDESYSYGPIRAGIVRPKTTTALYTLEKMVRTFKLTANFRSNPAILDLFNNVYRLNPKSEAGLQPVAEVKLNQDELIKAVYIYEYSSKLVADNSAIRELVNYIRPKLGQGETIAVLTYGIEKIGEFEKVLATLFPTETICCLSSEQENSHLYISKLSEKLESILYKRREIPGFNAFEEIIKYEAIKVNHETCSGNLNKVDDSILGWLNAEKEKNRMSIIRNLKDPLKHDREVRRLQLSMLDYKAENDRRYIGEPHKNGLNNAQSPDIVLANIIDAAGLEYEHVACIINRYGYEKYKTIASKYIWAENIGLTRAKKTELIMYKKSSFADSLMLYYFNYMNIP